MSNVLHGHCHPERAKRNIIATCVEKYGSCSPLGKGPVRDKFTKDHLDKWGVKNPMQREVVKNKVKETMLERFGVDNPQKSPEIKKKSDASRRHKTVITHWKTGETIIAVGSYETAFVKWLNESKTDYDWQIPFVVTSSDSDVFGRTYFVDAKITSGDLAGTYVEIKGVWIRKTQLSKWSWFHSKHKDDSQLWTLDVLKKKGIL